LLGGRLVSGDFIDLLEEEKPRDVKHREEAG
jgi:hypothetical protein